MAGAGCPLALSSWRHFLSVVSDARLVITDSGGIQEETTFLGIPCLTMRENTERGCKEFGAIHCVFPAGNAVVAAKEVEEIVEAQWKDLGMPETLWHCHVKEFGPLIVSIDSYGKNYFEEMKVEYNKRKGKEIERISKEVGFIK